MTSRKEVADLLARYGLRPHRSLGQHYLADGNVVRKMVRIAGVERGDRVVEVGPGTGTLTRELAATGALVLSFEVDDRLAPLLAETVGDLPNVTVRFADALKVDWQAELGAGPWLFVANLPYNVGTPLLLDLLRSVPTIRRFVVMVQSEVADRLAASPRNADYGLPSVVAQLHASVRVAFRVPAQVFLPPPRVGSAVVLLDRMAASEAADMACRLAAAAFGQRRKMLRRSLAGALKDAPARLAAASIPDTARAEELSPADYLRLAEVVGG